MEGVFLSTFFLRKSLSSSRNVVATDGTEQRVGGPDLGLVAQAAPDNQNQRKAQTLPR